MGDCMKKYALITGTSSGIGEEFAKQLSKDYHLILTARREDRLLRLKEKYHCDIIVADLSKEEDCFRVYDSIKDKKIDIFINNAGFGDCGYFIETDMNKELDMINVNIKALHILTKLMLQHMMKYNEGYILNVASSAGFIPAGPYMSTYYATKSYVKSLTLGIAEEIKDSSLYIGCLCPGPVDTEFNSVANVEFSLNGISKEYCVSYALKKMYNKKKIIIPGLMMKLVITLGKFLPVKLYVKIAAHQQKKKFIEK